MQPRNAIEMIKWNASLMQEGCADREALKMGISAIRKLSHLTGRPCEVCDCRSEKGCCVWECVFDGKENNGQKVDN